jgi:pantoate--beta-alanine ligase
MPVTIIGMPTIRETDGLALSSRNAYLDPVERKTAPLLFQVLCRIKSEIEKGNRDYANLERQAIITLDEAGFVTDYVAVADAATLSRPPVSNDLVILAAARLGRARLIDNVLVRRLTGVKIPPYFELLKPGVFPSSCKSLF